MEDDNVSAVRRCDLCGETFENAYQLGPHKKFCWNRQNLAGESSEFSNSDFAGDCSADSCDNHFAPPNDFAGAEVEVNDGLWSLSQRSKNWGLQSPVACDERVRPRCNPGLITDYGQMQKTWESYITSVTDLCTPDFWDTFRVLYRQPASCADQILHKIYDILRRTDLPSGHRWPTSVRSLNQRIKSKAGWFWDNVMHEHTIDLRRFRLPGVKRVQFNFVDPAFVYIMQCQKLIESRNKLVWEPAVLKDPSGEEIYGAGIQYGLLLRAAKLSVPREGDVALMNLSWDGGNTGFLCSHLLVS